MMTAPPPRKANPWDRMNRKQQLETLRVLVENRRAEARQNAKDGFPKVAECQFNQALELEQKIIALETGKGST